MAKKIPPAPVKFAAATPRTTEIAAVTTPVRNSAVPPRSAAIATAPSKKSAPTYEAIALRAYFIWKNSGGNSFDNWIRAERELSI
ncbi:MAG TPA: DUF2934 domain-containing protein [Tepidisphaeraceae bacterium]|jgi:hypothetical protein|nr:DUF2934 domain-containing protein [Tepidisphaeraceae bacterium]